MFGLIQNFKVILILVNETFTEKLLVKLCVRKSLFTPIEQGDEFGSYATAVAVS